MTMKVKTLWQHKQITSAKHEKTAMFLHQYFSTEIMPMLGDMTCAVLA